MLNKRRGACLHNPVHLYQKISDELKKHVYANPSDYMVATDQEIQLEAMRMAAMRKIPYSDAQIL